MPNTASAVNRAVINVIGLRVAGGGSLSVVSQNLPAARHSESANPRRERCRPGLQVVADVPDRAVVRRIDRGLSVVLPAQSVLLRRLSLGEYHFAKVQAARRIGRASACESLARIDVRSAE